MGARLKGAKTLGNANRGLRLEYPRYTHLLLSALSPSHICASCRRTIISQRRSASTATASESTDQIVPPLPPQSQDRPTESSSSATVPNPYYAVNCSVVLSRPPILTRDLTPFESAYFLYQRRLNERTALPFTRYFYYKKGTPADLEWKRKQRERVTPAREIGKYNAYSKEGWNDEILVGAKEAERETQVESLLRDAEDTAEPEGEENDGITAHVTRKKAEIERPESRRTKADQDGDLRSLNRLLERALYLLVKDNEGRWVFPTGRIEGKEGLHKVYIYHRAFYNANPLTSCRLPNESSHKAPDKT